MVEEGDQRKPKIRRGQRRRLVRRQELLLRPTQDAWKLDPNAAYVHYTPNETIGGVEIFWTPETGNVPLVADMSSNILSRPIDVSKFGLIYAGAQKNIGPAGLTIVIVREDLLGRNRQGTPTMFDYKIAADNDSMYNTPPTYAIYIAGTGLQDAQRPGAASRRWKRSIAPRPSCSTTHSTPPVSTNRRSPSKPFADEHPLHAQRTRRSTTSSSKAPRRAAWSDQGPPLGRRHARIDLQRHAGRGVQALVDWMKEFESCTADPHQTRQFEEPK